MPYDKRSPEWKEGEKGFAADLNRIEKGIAAVAANSINIQEAPYNAIGDGSTNNGPAINAALEAAGPPGQEVPVVVPPGVFATTEPLKVPAGVAVLGMNQPRSRLLAKGNIDLFRLQGANEMAALTLYAETEQTAGSAVDCSHGKPDNIWLQNITLGSNFFNGFNLVGESGEFGGVHMRAIHFVDNLAGTGVKGYKGAGMVIGSTTVRTVGVFATDIHMQVASTSGMARGIAVNNSDSIHLSQILLQNPKVGLATGNADTSAKRSTNVFLQDVQADGCGEGFVLASLLEEARLWGCSAEACGTGLILSESTSGLTIAGSSFFHNESHGMLVLGSVLPTYGNSIIGNHIHSNGENSEAGIAGIKIEEKAGGLLIASNSIGNPALIGGGKQKIGVLVGKKAENIKITGNRIFKNVTAQVKKEGEEVAVTSEGNLET